MKSFRAQKRHKMIISKKSLQGIGHEQQSTASQCRPFYQKLLPLSLFL
jgi:hypothetical protein